jgi:ribonuclease G
MHKELIIATTSQESKLAILEDDELVEYYIERRRSQGIVGNIYKGRVTKVLPGMQSAFVDIGLERDAFLYVSDFLEDTDEYEKIVATVEAEVRQSAGSSYKEGNDSGDSADYCASSRARCRLRSRFLLTTTSTCGNRGWPLHPVKPMRF